MHARVDAALLGVGAAGLGLLGLPLVGGLGRLLAAVLAPALGLVDRRQEGDPPAVGSSRPARWRCWACWSADAPRRRPH